MLNKFWEKLKKWLSDCLSTMTEAFKKCGFIVSRSHLSWHHHNLYRNHSEVADLRLRWVEGAVVCQAGSLVGHCTLAEHTYWEHRWWEHKDLPYLSSWLLFPPHTLKNNCKNMTVWNNEKNLTPIVYSLLRVQWEKWYDSNVCLLSIKQQIAAA